MKVKLLKKDRELTKKQYDLFRKFIAFLQKNFPLKQDVTICFLSDRVGEMTTGSSIPELRKMNILTRNRLNRDILRTMAHEWVHEHQISILKREVGQNIGGRNEDEANAYAGRLVKMFEKDFPYLEKINYE